MVRMIDTVKSIASVMGRDSFTENISTDTYSRSTISRPSSRQSYSRNSMNRQNPLLQKSYQLRPFSTAPQKMQTGFMGIRVDNKISDLVEQHAQQGAFQTHFEQSPHKPDVKIYVPEIPTGDIDVSAPAPPPVEEIEEKAAPEKPQSEDKKNVSVEELIDYDILNEDKPSSADNNYSSAEVKQIYQEMLKEFELDEERETDTEESNAAETVYDELIIQLEEIYRNVALDMEEEINLKTLIPNIKNLLDVIEMGDYILRKAIKLKQGNVPITIHALNQTIISIYIGTRFKYSYGKKFSLAMCSLLGDTGMMNVPPEILAKKGKLSPEDIQAIRDHVIHSAEILERIGKDFPFLATIALQIHERENGSGYPNGLQGDEINELARIIGLCDTYVAMTEPKAHRNDYSGYAALQDIISRRGIDFSPKIIKTLIDVISVFPLESLVRLNNDMIGRVIGTSKNHPTRPNIQILIDQDGRKVKKFKTLDLENEPMLFVADPNITEGALL